MNTAVVAPTTRNSLCPCGSGRRFKECHGALAAPHAGGFVPERPRQRDGFVEVLESEWDIGLPPSDPAELSEGQGLE